MSSSTSSSDRYRRFAVTVWLAAFVPAAIFFVYGIYLQPVEELPRVGAHSQREFGWNEPQDVFPSLRYDTGSYDKAYDVVVVGDSFAIAMPPYQWQNQLASATGLRVVTLSTYDVPVNDVLNNPHFVDNPPAVLILTLVERHLPQRLANEVECEDPSRYTGWKTGRNAGKLQAPAALSEGLPTIPGALRINRETRWADLREVKIGYAAKVAFYNLIRATTGYEPSKVVRVRLDRGDLFSSEVSDATLIWNGDLKKTSAWETVGLDRLSCLIETMRQKVEANGKTRFLLVIPPDKLTAYDPWISESPFKGLSRLAELTDRHLDTIPRIDLALHSAIISGHKDVYLPNNTHWGIAGHLTVGQTVAAFLRNLSSGKRSHEPSP